jgi:adenylate cyclase
LAREQRRLAAIIAADVVGYSCLMGRDESGTLARLREHRRERFEPTLARHGGRLVKLTGDGALAEFPSAVDALGAAIEFQQAMADANRAQPEDTAIVFRIGLHLGDLIVDGDDLYGDGVNVAARLEAEAPAGGIVISRNVHDAVDGRLKATFEDLGSLALKNIERPTQAFRVGWESTDWQVSAESAARPAAIAARPSADLPLTLPDKPSIAVLPFQNMSGDPEQEYFADGMVEEIITALSRIRWLFVIARNSSFRYKGQSVDVKQVGRELGVRYVLEGSVRKAGNRVRITAQLIEAGTGTHVWAERYDRSLDDIFALQDEITLSTVGAIEPSLREAEIERVKRKRPENLDAYDLVLRALPHVYAAMTEEAQKAVPLLQRALALEPDYGLAHAFLAWCFEVLYTRGGFDPAHGAAATHHAHAAIAHARDDATALGLAAFVTAMVAHDRRAAIETFETALTLSPSCSIALMCGSVAMGFAGEAERALTWGEQAVRLSPFDRLIYAAHHGLAMGHFINRRYEEAANAARRAIQSNPGFSLSHMFLAAALAGLGRVAEAKAAAARVLALQPNFRIGEFCAGLAIPAVLAVPLTEACLAAGLPK